MIEYMPDHDVNEFPPIDHPLFKLGNLLAHYLDDDKFNECERLLLDGWSHDAIDRKTGQSWRENSSLEVWFPITHQNLMGLLSGTYYMDYPDGGDVSVIEQLRRVAKDAGRYRWLREKSMNILFFIDEEMYYFGDMNANQAEQDELDRLTDTAIAREREG